MREVAEANGGHGLATWLAGDHRQSAVTTAESNQTQQPKNCGRSDDYRREKAGKKLSKLHSGIMGPCMGRNYITKVSPMVTTHWFRASVCHSDA